MFLAASLFCSSFRLSLGAFIKRQAPPTVKAGGVQPLSLDCLRQSWTDSEFFTCSEPRINTGFFGGACSSDGILLFLRRYPFVPQMVSFCSSDGILFGFLGLLSGSAALLFGDFSGRLCRCFFCYKSRAAFNLSRWPLRQNKVNH